VCSLASAKSDFEKVMQLKPNHSQAVKELAALQELESAVKELDAVAAQSDTAGAAVDAAAAQQLLERVYKNAPDCIAAQLLEAKLQMAQRNYEEVRMLFIKGNSLTVGGCWLPPVAHCRSGKGCSCWGSRELPAEKCTPAEQCSLGVPHAQQQGGL
jgi:hypothetical protein